MELFTEEEQESRSGQQSTKKQSGSPAAFILLGLKIKALQDKLKYDAEIGTNASATQVEKTTTRMEWCLSL